MKSAIYGALEIGAGQSNVVLAGGFESMSNAPHLLKTGRKGHKFGDFAAFDSLSHDGLIDAYKKIAMGFCGEKTAKEMGISRELQDFYCITSYERALEANLKGWFNAEIAPVEIKTGSHLSVDEEPAKFVKDRIAKAKPAFADKDGQGTITAGNASKLNDGACSLLLMSEKGLKQTGLTPLAEIVAFGDAEVAPIDFNISPPLAANKALERAGLKVSDIDFWEANEAFSVTGIAFMKSMGIKHDQLNVNGGAVALGHPIGMSGARILLSLANTLKHRHGKYGLAAICNGGGGSSAVVLKAV
jgi:acetyl-CoA C-acetyltransferase